MRRRLMATLLVAGALVLAACSPISSGTITEKRHTAGYYYTTQQCASYNKDGLCSVYIPIQNWQPPTWVFDIRDGKDNGWVYVTEDAYGRYSVGDYFQGD